MFARWKGVNKSLWGSHEKSLRLHFVTFTWDKVQGWAMNKSTNGQRRFLTNQMIKSHLLFTYSYVWSLLRACHPILSLIFNFHRYIQSHPVSQCLFVFSTMHIGRTMTWERKNKWKNGNQLTGILSHGVFIFLIDAGVDDDFLLFIFVLWDGSSLLLLSFFFSWVESVLYYNKQDKNSIEKNQRCIKESITEVCTLYAHCCGFFFLSVASALEHLSRGTNEREQMFGIK